VYGPVSVDEARRRLLNNRQTGERYDVRDDDFELAVSMFEPPEGGRTWSWRKTFVEFGRSG
jgi:hypothetical protein